MPSNLGLLIIESLVTKCTLLSGSPLSASSGICLQSSRGFFNLIQARIQASDNPCWCGTGISRHCFQDNRQKSLFKKKQRDKFYREITKVDYDGSWEECPNHISTVISKSGRGKYRTGCQETSVLVQIFVIDALHDIGQVTIQVSFSVFIICRTMGLG